MKKDICNKDFEFIKFKNNGITLIALIIAIVIIFIISAITFSTISQNNSIIKETYTSKEAAQKADEREAIQQLIAYYEGSKSTNSSYYIGTPLFDKNEENINSWEMIIVDNGKICYGTGWNYIPKGTDVYDYGKTKYEWVANYYTGEVDALIEGEYTKSSYKDEAK